ncbi:MAG: malto-oligosyltrehalose synthase [Planctomycetes bacterium]|nr:malto-oligosyltrehalose synthase [Planctomycetota bacterium]
MNGSPAPAATYRIQFNRDFRFQDARAIVPYLSRLGVTHVYSSPVLRARGESTHGYDVVDPGAVNPDLGDETAFRELAETLHAHGMGLVLDIVPNHMAAGHENRYWQDVLKYGPASQYARWFDIDWRLPDPKSFGRVLVPILGQPLPRVLAAGEIRVVWFEGRFIVRYWDHVFPLDPATVPAICRFGLERLEAALEPGHSMLAELKDVLAELRRLPRRTVRMRRRVNIPIDEAERCLARLAQLIEFSPLIHDWAEATAQTFGEGDEGRRRLRKLLDAQSYRLVYWRMAARGINYRRFFDINDLISIRQEDPQVFEETHALIARWIREGVLDGVRVDHIDGLRDPLSYLERLRGLVADRIDTGRPFRIYVEKILGHNERLPPEWPVEGTTGYEFLNQLEDVFLLREGFGELVEAYQQMLGRPLEFKDVAAWGKRRILRHDLSAFVGRLADLLLRLARYNPANSHLTMHSLVSAIVETVVALPVYRTYITAQRRVASAAERAQLEVALAGARDSRRAPAEAIDFLETVLLLKNADALPENEHQERVSFIERFQQLTGPATAKGVEDTALYAWVPLASRNEVGSEPDVPLDLALEHLHAENCYRARSAPSSMLAATTHDTKRSADVRSRLDVLSELPRLWQSYVERWRRLNRPHRRRASGRVAPDRAAESLAYQTLLGIWPAPDPLDADGGFPGPEALAELRDRLDQYMLKAVREAKTRTSWVKGNPQYEQALSEFLRAAVDPERGRESPFLADVHVLCGRIARHGCWNALSRTLVQFTAPGTPDLYQGDELWNHSLVDPDNRRPVDYDHRQRVLDDLVLRLETSDEDRRRVLAELVERPEDGRIKLLAIRAALHARREHPALFAAGDYQPLEAEGQHAGRLLAFARSYEERAMIVLVPQLTTGLVSSPLDAPVGEAVWGDTWMRLPEQFVGRRYRSALTRETLDYPADGGLPVAKALESIPAALWIAEAP